MKIDFYFDWHPGLDPRFAAAYANPNMIPMEGAKRFKFTVELENPYTIDAEKDVKAVEVKS